MRKKINREENQLRQSKWNVMNMNVNMNETHILVCKASDTKRGTAINLAKNGKRKRNQPINCIQ